MQTNLIDEQLEVGSRLCNRVFFICEHTWMSVPPVHVYMLAPGDSNLEQMHTDGLHAQQL